ncbi:MAG: hypothetical protein R2852_08670 [Bacteroidia bacterium]
MEVLKLTASDDVYSLVDNQPMRYPIRQLDHVVAIALDTRMAQRSH